MTQKLKTYNTEAEVPTELKGFYGQSAAGKWEPQFEGVDSISGLVAKRDELLGKVSGHSSELSAKQAEIDRLAGDLASARSSSLPRGHKAVPTADAELVEAVKAAGVTDAAAFNTLKTKHDEYKTTAEAAQAAKHAADVAEAMGWDKEKTARTATKVYDFSALEVREADGKKSVVAKVRQADGSTVVEKPFGDVVKATPELSDLLPSLAANGQTGVRVPGSTPGAGSTGGQKSMVDSFIEDRDKAAASRPNPFAKAAPAVTA